MSTKYKEFSNDRVISKQFFSLLPAQILLVFIPSLNGIISGLFGSNMLGEKALTAIGIFAPAISLIGAATGVMMGGAQILTGRYMGKNQVDRTQQIFSLDLAAVGALSLVISAVFAIAALFGLTGFLNSDPEVIRMFNGYILGVSIGIVPMMLSNQLSVFLSMEMEGNRSSQAMGMFVVINFFLTWLFLKVFRFQTFGLALAGAIGYWVSFLYQIAFYFSGKSILKVKLPTSIGPDLAEMIAIGFPGALTSLYMTVRRLVFNT